MESINQVIDIVRLNVYMASIDLKDAFYFIPIHPAEHQKYLKFVVLSKIYQYSATHIFTKYPKSSFHTYEGKSLYQWYLLTIHTCRVILLKKFPHNIEGTNELLLNLGITIHPAKSFLTPTQRITFLGFVIDSVKITLEIVEEKKNKISTKRTLCSRHSTRISNPQEEVIYHT